MYLIQILLPVSDNENRPIPPQPYRRVATELTERFRGLTAYTRAPAEGRWKEKGESTIQEEIVVYEVMAPALDVAWWRDYRHELEARFHQEVVIIRAQEIQLL